MDYFDFNIFRQVSARDAPLRNAIRMESVVLAQNAIERGANINCQYPDDWNSPLQMAIAGGCQSIVELLISHRPDYRLVNGENETAAEMALAAGKESMARILIEAEFRGFGPVEALYEMLKRKSLDALEILIEMLNLSQRDLALSLAKAWNKLEVMNVKMESELELYVHLTLIRIDYEENEGAKVSQHKLIDEGVDQRLQLVLREIDILRNEFNTGLCNDVCDEFLERLRLILKQLFILKNRVEYFPVLQLEYCVAMFLAVHDRKQEFELFQFVINKRLIMEFLAQFKNAYKRNSIVDRRMTTELLYKLTKRILINRLSKCKRIIIHWRPIVCNLYNTKEQIMIRNKISKNSLMAFDHSISFNDLGKDHINILKLEADSINKMFETRKSRYRYKSLFKVYFRLKQMYSLQKTFKYLQMLDKIDLNIYMSSFTPALAILRILQIVGETLKATQLSPNISTNLRSTLDLVSPAEILNRIGKFRNYFSHNYSLTKHSVYTVLRENEKEFIEMLKNTQTDLQKITPSIENVLKNEYVRYFKVFLGYVLQMKTSDEVKSLAGACKVSNHFRLNSDLNIADIPSIENILNELQISYCPSNQSENLDVLAKIHRRLKYYQQTLTSAVDVTNLVIPSIGAMLTNDRLDHQQNYAKFLLRHIGFPQAHEYGINSLIMYNLKPDIYKLLELETKQIDTRSDDRLAIINNLMKLAQAENITVLHTFTIGKEHPTIDSTRDLVKSVGLNSLVDELLLKLDKSLAKYYTNLFALDDKYRNLKTFCKFHKLDYNNELVLKSRRKDERFYQYAFDNLIQDILRLVSLPQNMKTVELFTLVASFQKLLSDSPDALAIEVVLLEVLDILTTIKVLPDNRTNMTSIRPFISGRNLRNYLAHDSLVYDTICRNRKSPMTVFLNAICLTKFVKFNVFNPRRGTVNVECSESLEDVHNMACSLIMQKKKFFENLSSCDFQNIIFEKFEYKAKLYDNCSILETVMRKHTREFTEFLIGRVSPVLHFFKKMLKFSPNEICNFYDEDTFVIRDVVVNEALRQNMSFYMSVLYKHFDLETDIGSIYGAIYEADSLNIAILFGNTRTALSIIDSPNLYKFCTQDSLRHDQTVLMLATMYKQSKVVRAICEKSPEMLECTNTLEESALHTAVVVGSKEIVEILLEFGAKPHHHSKSALINALSVRKDDILEVLLPSDEKLMMDQELLAQIVDKAGLSNHYVLLGRLLPMVKGNSPLVKALNSAALQGHLEAVEVLLRFNPSIVNEISTLDETALYNACHSGSRQTVKLLLRYGADCNLPEQYSALDYVVDMNRRQMLKLFLENNIISEQHRATLFEKVYSSRPKMAWMVFLAGYPYRIYNRQLHINVLRLYLKMIRVKPELSYQMDCHILSKAIVLRNKDFFKCVLEAAGSRMAINERVRLINTSLQANDKEILNYLIGIGFEIDQPDCNGVTPLGLAVLLKKQDFIRILLKAGADPNVESTGNGSQIIDLWTLVGPWYAEHLQQGSYVSYPIIFAIAINQNKIVECMMQYGTDVNICDRYGVTPLIGAILAGNRALVELLLNHGANMDRARQFVDSIFHSGTVLHESAKNGYLDVFQFLVERCDFELNVCDSHGNTVLHTAIKNGRDNVVCFLKDSDHWNTPNKSGETPLEMSLKKLNEHLYRVIRHLPGIIEYMKYFRDEKQRSLLHLATIHGRSTSYVNILLTELELDINSLDELKQTPLHYAMCRYDLELVKLLLTRGSSLALLAEQTFASFLSRGVLLNKVESIEFCLKTEEFTQKIVDVRGANCNLLELSMFVDSEEIFKMLYALDVFDTRSIQTNGDTTIHLAASIGSVRIMDLLVSKEAQLEVLNQKGKTPLIVAIEAGNWKMTKYLLSKRASKQPLVEYRYEDRAGMNILHYVASTGRLASLQILLDEKVFARTIPDDKGRTIGHYAAANNQANIIDFLATNMFPFDMVDEDGRTSLIYAIEHKHLKLALRLIRFGCSLKNVHSYNEKHSLLKHSMENGKIETIKFLKEHCNLFDSGIELSSLIPERLIKAYQTRLELLQQNKIKELKECIAKDGQPIDIVNSQGRTLLHESILRENFEAVKILLELGMPVELIDKQNTTPLILALLKNNQSLAKYLINAGSSFESVKQFRSSNRDQSTLLHIAAQCNLTASLKLLLEHGTFDVDVGDIDRTTALQEAASRGHGKCVELLLQNGADVEFVDLEGTNALTRAFCGSQEKIVNLLLERGVSLENSREFRVPNSKGESLLHLVATGNNPNLIDILVGVVGIDVDVLDGKGRSALHYAAENGMVEATGFLLNNGARRDVLDENVEFPLITAISAGHGDKLAELLLPNSLEDCEYLASFRLPESQKSLLHIAFEKKSYQLLRMLINNYNIGVGLVDSDGSTVLHYAAAEKNMLVMEQVTFSCELFFIQDFNGKSPLNICIEKEDEISFQLILNKMSSCGNDCLIEIFKCIVKFSTDSMLNQYCRWLLVERKDFVAEFVAMNNNLYTLKVLVECGLEKSTLLDSEIAQHFSFLHAAVFKNYDQFALILIEQLKMEVNSLDENMQPPLVLAIVLKHYETAHVLLKNKANVNFQDKHGRTPLLTALEHDHKEMVQLLLLYGASIELMEEFRYQSENKFTPLHYMAERGLTNSLPLVLPLMAVNCVDVHEMTPLHYAAGSDQGAIIDLLIAAGCSVNAADKHGSTPLLRAAAKGHMGCFELLRRHGADVDLLKHFRNVNFDNESMLHITAEKGLLDMTKKLVEEFDVDLDCQDKDGRTPLNYAIEKRRFEVVKYLLHKKACLYVENSEGITPLQLLCEVESDFEQPSSLT